jgi:hypothetical protein
VCAAAVMNYGLNMPQKGGGGQVGRGKLDVSGRSRNAGDSSMLQDGQASRPPNAPAPFLYAAQDPLHQHHMVT